MIGKKEFIDFIKEIVEDKKGSRIAILVSLFKRYEGASKVVEHQAMELSKSGYSVSIFTFETNINLNGVEIKTIRPFIPLYSSVYRGLFFLDILTMIKLINELKIFDLIIIHHGNMAILGYIVKKLFKTKVIFWNHHIDDKSRAPLQHRIYRAIFEDINWSFIRKFDYVVSVSHFSQEQLKARKRINSLVIYNKIDERFKEGLNGDLIRRKYGLKDEPLLLFVGRIVPYKNIHMLIDILNHLKKDVPNVKLLIIGRRDDIEYYKKLVKMVDDSVFFEENVPEEELPFYYAACDVYVTCSELEGFNLPLVEAQACGKPVVAFDIGPHREIVKRGYLVKPYDILEFKQKVLELLVEESIVKTKRGGNFENGI